MEKFRKFGLDFCDLPTMIANMSTLLRLFNIKISRKNDSRINIFVYIFWIACNISYYYVYVFSATWFVFIKCPRTGDLIAASVVFSLATCSQPSFIKMFYMIFYKDRIQNLIDDYLALNDLVKPGSRFSKNLHIHLRIIKKRATILWATMSTNGFLYVAIPIMMPGRHLPEDLQVIYGLDPMFETPHFEIASVMMALSVYLCVFSLSNITAFNLVILGYSESQMIALSQELTHLWQTAEEFSTSLQKRIHPRKYGTKLNQMNAYIKECLKEIVFLHIRNIHIIEEFERVFRFTRAIEFSFLILAIISELLGGIQNTYLQIPFTIVLILMECFAGQRLMDACVMFEDAVYNCNWQMFDVSNRKTVLLLLVSAQRTLGISAGGLAKLNFRFLLSIMKFSYSTYNTLRLMMN